MSQYSLLPPRLCISRQLESEARKGTSNVGIPIWDTDVFVEEIKPQLETPEGKWTPGTDLEKWLLTIIW